MGLVTIPAWLCSLITAARQRFDFARQRRKMQRFAQLDGRFPADIGLTASEVERGYCLRETGVFVGGEGLTTGRKPASYSK